MPIRYPKHNKDTPESPCVGCDSDNVRECEKRADYMCLAWKRYIRIPDGGLSWQSQDRGVFK